MSADDYLTRALSDNEVRRWAKKLRDYYGVSTKSHVDILDCLQTGRVLTVRGEERLVLKEVSDEAMATDEARTSYEPGVVTITSKRGVIDRARFGVGRDRNTLAHELGHGVLHNGAPKARRVIGNVTPRWIRPFESAEHQAKVFAPAFLIHDAIAETLESAEQISTEFGVSLESASIHFQQLTRLRIKPESAQRVALMAERFKATMSPPPREQIKYMQDPCTACGKRTVFPVGHKYMCQSCDTIYDRFQDGDRAE